MNSSDLFGSIYEGEWYQIENYLRAGGNVNIVDEQGRTLLHFAAERGKFAIVRMLLRMGANINQQDNEEKTPLHYAVIEYVDQEGQHLNNDAVFEADREDGGMIKLLVKKYADIYILDSEDRTPYSIIRDYEAEHDRYRLAEWMKDYQATWNDRNQQEEVVAANIPSRNIPAGSSNTISYANIADGSQMVNFHNEFNKGRYYTQNTYNSIQTNERIGRKRNPYTRAPIDEITSYKAHIVGVEAEGGKRKSKKTRKSKKSRKSKKTRKH